MHDRLDPCDRKEVPKMFFNVYIASPSQSVDLIHLHLSRSILMQHCTAAAVSSRTLTSHHFLGTTQHTLTTLLKHLPVYRLEAIHAVSARLISTTIIRLDPASSPISTRPSILSTRPVQQQRLALIVPLIDSIREPRWGRLHYFLDTFPARLDPYNSSV